MNVCLWTQSLGVCVSVSKMSTNIFQGHAWTMHSTFPVG